MLAVIAPFFDFAAVLSFAAFFDISFGLVAPVALAVAFSSAMSFSRAVSCSRTFSRAFPRTFSRTVSFSQTVAYRRGTPFLINRLSTKRPSFGKPPLGRFSLRPLFTARHRRAALLSLVLGLAGCQTPSPQIEDRAIDGTLAAAERLLDSAASASGEEQWELRLSAVELLIDLREMNRAESEAVLLPASPNLPPNLSLRTDLVRARLALARNETRRAQTLLAGLSTEQLDLLGVEARISATVALAAAETQLNNAERALAFLLSRPLAEAAAATLTPAGLHSLNEQTWRSLNTLDPAQLSRLAAASESYHARGWIELNRAVRREGYSLRGQLDAIARWQRVWAQHPANSAMPQELLGLARAWDQRPRHVALALPLQLAAGRALQEGFTAAYYQALAISREVPRISLIDSSETGDVVELIDAALAHGADFMIGPLSKNLVNQLAELPSLPLPTLALNYAETTGQGDVSPPAGLAQFGLAPEDEIDQLVTLARERGFSRAAVIVPEGESYARLQDEFRSRWNAAGGQVVAEERLGRDEDYTEVTKRLLAIDASENRARRLRATLPRNNIEFIPQRRGDIDFAFLISPASEARQLVPTLAFYYAEDLPLFALPSIFDGAQDAASRDLDGLVFKDAPWMLSVGELRAETDAHLAPALGASQRLRAMGVDSFYLAMQLQQLREDPRRALAGVTGTLQVAPSGRVNRRLLTARFENGRPVIID